MFSRHDDDKANPEPRLNRFSTAELTAELERRGSRVVSGEALEEASQLLYWGWTVIANAGGGLWRERESPEWIKAAESYRDSFHAFIREHERAREPA